MATTMTKERLIDRNVYYYIKNAMTAWYASLITVDSFNKVAASLPCVVVNEPTFDYESLELGTGSQLVTSTFVVDIFASSGGQATDIASKIRQLLEVNAPYIDFNVHFPEDVGYDAVAQRIGTLSFSEMRSEALVFDEFNDLSAIDKHRRIVTFTVECDQS